MKKNQIINRIFKINVQNEIQLRSYKVPRLFIHFELLSYFCYLFVINIYRHHASPATDRVCGDPVLLDLRHGLAAHVAHGGPQLLRLRANC